MCGPPTAIKFAHPCSGAYPSILQPICQPRHAKSMIQAWCFTPIFDTAMRQSLCNGMVCVCLSQSQLSTAAAVCSRFAAVGPASKRQQSIARRPARSSTVHSSKCEQCHIYSCCRRLDTNLFHLLFSQEKISNNINVMSLARLLVSTQSTVFPGMNTSLTVHFLQRHYKFNSANPTSSSFTFHFKIRTQTYNIRAT